MVVRERGEHCQGTEGRTDGAGHAERPDALHAGHSIQLEGPDYPERREGSCQKPAAEIDQTERRGNADPGHQQASRQTSMISSSLPFTNASTCLIASSWSFWTSFSTFFLSSSDTCSAFFTLPIASVRECRMETFPSSASLCITFTSSLRRSSVRGGMGIRMITPSWAGLSPRLDAAMPFSMGTISDLSHGCTVSRR